MGQDDLEAIKEKSKRLGIIIDSNYKKGDLEQ